MKILKEKSRMYKGNAYFKYKVNIPSGALERAKLKEGDEVDITAEVSQIKVSKKGKNKQEFDGIRSKLYKEALEEFPNARSEDIAMMKKFLTPKPRERILEIGAGNGYFSEHISELIGEHGRLIVADPSLEQLENIKNLSKNNIDTIQFVQIGSETANLEKQKVDAIWSCGAMHHISQKRKSFENMKRILKENGRVVIADVLVGSKLARHFDDKVAKYCITGHEVSFLSKEYIESLCYLCGFAKPEFYEVNLKWKFDKKSEIGVFLHKLHAMTTATPEECLKGAEKILGITKKKGSYYLQWPLMVFVTRHRT